MTYRITEKMLQMRVDYLNKLVGAPMTPYSKNADGEHVANIGNYHLSWAYGGVCLHKMHNDGGGVSTPLSSGHVPKKELFNELCAFIRGVEFAKENK